jgi:protein-disulfide isomerase
MSLTIVAIAILTWMGCTMPVSAQAPPSVPPPNREVVDIGTAPTLGPSDAPVTIIEFSDFECPYCAKGSRTLRRLLTMYPTQVKLVFKHYPLRNHRQAALAHEAALAAREQGKFWEMYRTLFAQQGNLGRDDLLRYATSLGLDVPAFSEALDSRRHRQEVFRDIIQGRRHQITATPTYFVNGRRFIGSRNIEEFKRIVDEELASVAPEGSPKL